MRYTRIRYLDRFILYDFIRNLIILCFLIPRSPNFNANKLKKCHWKAIRILPLVHSIHIKQSVHAIQQMATRLQPLTIAGTYGSIRGLWSGHMRAHGVYRDRLITSMHNCCHWISAICIVHMHSRPSRIRNDADTSTIASKTLTH